MGGYLTVTGTAISPEPKPFRKRLPEPGLPPVTSTVAVVLPAGTMTSGMITLSGASVVTSSSRPPVGAGVGRVKERVWVSPRLRVCSEGLTLRLVGSTRKVPTMEVPLAPEISTL